MYLSLRDISKSFKNVDAVRGISLDIEKGKLVSLLGPSGCGKTTTLKMIGGFIRPSGGGIFLDGSDITLLPAEKRPVSTVFQNYALFPHMSVIQNVVYGLKFKRGLGKKQARAMGEEMLEVVGLSDFASTRVTRLSGGQQQRVALARSLILSPKVLLLDEPLSNLDAKLRVKMRTELKQIQRRFGITMVFVTHDQAEAMSISDEIVVMNDGVVEQVGTPEQVYKSPKSAFVADFIGSANRIEGAGGGESRLVRPENMTMSKESGSYEGVVRAKHFLGAVTTYFVDVSGKSVQVDMMSCDDHLGLVPGESVFLDERRV